MGERGFCDVEQNESDIRRLRAKVHHLQHQAFLFKKNHNPTVYAHKRMHIWSTQKISPIDVLLKLYALSPPYL